VKVAQSQLRHTTPKITLELYAQAVAADQQKAHRQVVQMVLHRETTVAAPVLDSTGV